MKYVIRYNITDNCYEILNDLNIFFKKYLICVYESADLDIRNEAERLNGEKNKLNNYIAEYQFDLKNAEKMLEFMESRLIINKLRGDM